MAEQRRMERCAESRKAIQEQQQQFKFRLERQRLYDKARIEEQREMKVRSCSAHWSRDATCV